MYETSFNPEALEQLRSVFDKTVAQLSPQHRTEDCKSYLASCILDLYATGLRDMTRIQIAAVIELQSHITAVEQ